MTPAPQGRRPDARRPRPGTSRTGTHRPRRLAGSEPARTPAAADAHDDDTPLGSPAGPAEPTPKDDRGDRARDLLTGSGATRLLIGLVVVLTLVVAAEGWYLWRSGDEPRTASADQPVAVPERTWRPAVEAAAQGAEIILGGGWEEYDEGIESARAVMTDEFAETYLATKEDVRDEFVKDRTEVQVRVLGQAVTRATGSTVQALLFFDQYVTKKGAQTSFSQFRALVTVVDTPDGWLVDQIDTQ